MHLLQYRFFKKKKHLRALFYMFILSIGYAVFYYYLGREHLIFRDIQSDIVDVDFFNCFYFSVTVQSLLGTGEIIPQSALLKFAVITQIFSTLLINFIF